MSTYSVPDVGLSYENIEQEIVVYAINELKSSRKDEQLNRRLLVLLLRYLKNAIIGVTEEIIRSSGI